MNPCESLPLSTAPYCREARVTFDLAADCVRNSGIAGARRIEEAGGRRELGCTSIRWAERHPQGVCRIRKAAEPPTAAQQRMIGAASSRIATPNAATPRAGIPIPEAQKSFEPETANQKPFSWGFKGAILFCEREWPLCPRRPQAAYPLALVRRKGAFSHVRE